MLAMISAIFTVTWLQRHQEMTAMLAAGISKFRIVRPLLLAAIAVSLFAAASRELVIPRIRNELSRDVKNLSGSQAQDLESRSDSQTDILIGGEQAIVSQRRIVNPTFVLPAALSLYGKRLEAATADYLEATAEHPAGYLLTEVRAPKKIDTRAPLMLDKRVIVVTRHDADWLEPRQAFVVSHLPFELLVSGSNWQNYASTGELVAELSNPSTHHGAGVRVAVHARVLQPITDATLLMLGLPLMFSRRSRNVFLSIGICLLVSAAFSVVTLTCQSLGGLNLLRPTLAAWAPILIFGPLAVGMSDTLRT
jgi:lipopolysaccharide export system permease protein